jgi:hypothetical protein
MPVEYMDIKGRTWNTYVGVYQHGDHIAYVGSRYAPCALAMMSCPCGAFLPLGRSRDARMRRTCVAGFSSFSSIRGSCAMVLHATKLDSDYSWAVGLTPNNFLFISSLREAFSSGGREIWHELGVKVCPR